MIKDVNIIDVIYFKSYQFTSLGLIAIQITHTQKSFKYFSRRLIYSAAFIWGLQKIYSAIYNICRRFRDLTRPRRENER